MVTMMVSGALKLEQLLLVQLREATARSSARYGSEPATFLTKLRKLVKAR